MRFSGQVGVAVGFDRHSEFTTDGGASWKRCGLGEDYSLWSVYPVDENNWITVGDFTWILKYTLE